MANEVGRVRCRRMLDQTHYVRPFATLRHASFQLLFIRIPRTTLDILVPQMDNTEATGRISNFMENGRQNMREAAEARSKICESKQAGRQRRSAKISRPPAGVNIAEGDIVLAREGDCSLFRQGLGRELEHEKWTGPWTATKVVLKG